MATAPQNKYGVHPRLAALENAVTELRKENAELRVHLAGRLETLVNDARSAIQSAIEDAIRSSLALCKPGRDGVDGKDSTVPGPQGDVLIPSETELQQAVIALRIKLKEQHAAAIAPLVESIENEKKQEHWLSQHFARLLEGILADIVRLRSQLK